MCQASTAHLWQYYRWELATSASFQSISCIWSTACSVTAGWVVSWCQCPLCSFRRCSRVLPSQMSPWNMSCRDSVDISSCCRGVRSFSLTNVCHNVCYGWKHMQIWNGAIIFWMVSNRWHKYWRVIVAVGVWLLFIMSFASVTGKVSTKWTHLRCGKCVMQWSCNWSTG